MISSDGNALVGSLLSGPAQLRIDTPSHGMARLTFPDAGKARRESDLDINLFSD